MKTSHFVSVSMFAHCSLEFVLLKWFMWLFGLCRYCCLSHKPPLTATGTTVGSLNLPQPAHYYTPQHVSSNMIMYHQLAFCLYNTATCMMNEQMAEIDTKHTRSAAFVSVWCVCVCMCVHVRKDFFFISASLIVFSLSR